MAIIKKFRITTFKKEYPKIALKKISLSYSKRQILDDVSLTIRKGEICGVLGPNGVGKSTLFNIIIGLIKPDYGEVFINQLNVTKIPMAIKNPIILCIISIFSLYNFLYIPLFQNHILILILYIWIY